MIRFSDSSFFSCERRAAFAPLPAPEPNQNNNNLRLTDVNDVMVAWLRKRTRNPRRSRPMPVYMHPTMNASWMTRVE